MDYQFKRDIYGNPIAKISMEQELFGRWITDDLGSNLNRVEQFISIICQIEVGQRGYYQTHTGNFEVLLSMTEVEISMSDGDLHGGYNEQENQFIDESDLHGETLESSCGLTDIKSVLESWRDYIR